MADKQHQITIDSITCKGTADDGNDEVFILYQCDAGIPVRHPPTKYQRMNTKDNPDNDVVHVWDVKLTIQFDHEVLVTLWDHDSRTGYNKADFLMNVEYRSDRFIATCEVENHNGAHYIVTATKNR